MRLLRTDLLVQTVQLQQASAGGASIAYLASRRVRRARWPKGVTRPLSPENGGLRCAPRIDDLPHPKRPRPPSGELTEAAFYIASRLGSQCDVGALYYLGMIFPKTGSHFSGSCLHPRTASALPS